MPLAMNIWWARGRQAETQPPQVTAVCEGSRYSDSFYFHREPSDQALRITSSLMPLGASA